MDKGEAADALPKPVEEGAAAGAGAGAAAAVGTGAGAAGPKLKAVPVADPLAGAAEEEEGAAEPNEKLGGDGPTALCAAAGCAPKDGPPNAELDC